MLKSIKAVILTFLRHTFAAFSVYNASIENNKQVKDEKNHI